MLNVINLLLSIAAWAVVQANPLPPHKLLPAVFTVVTPLPLVNPTDV